MFTIALLSMSFVPVVNPHAERAAHPGTVLDIVPGSAASRLRIRRGDILLAINGQRVRDPIDYRFYGSDDRLVLEIRRNTAVKTLRVRKAPDEDLGVVLPELTLEDIAECNNHCPFCFVTQLPKGMRGTLHIKDDDYRFSFLNASFVTLTNLTDADWQRIGEQRLSPLYVSVHSTNPELRAKLLGNRRAPDILEQIDRLCSLGITVHTQLVLCPGLNDGEDLHSSVHDLLVRYPMVKTIAAVPVGLTRVRTERTASSRNPLRRFTPVEAARAIRHVRPYQRQNVARHGEPVVYLADEFYLLAGMQVPGRAHYTDLVQLENGVGMVRLLLDTWRAVRRRLPERLSAPRHLSMACGTLAYPVLASVVEEMNRIQNLRIDLYPIENQLFGKEVTVSGLIAGEDLIGRLQDAPLGDMLILPRVMFDRAGELTLDDVPVEAIAQRLHARLHIADGIGDLERLIV
jgi:putative radical SAM enzyme (TIGR03279 family)